MSERHCCQCHHYDGPYDSDEGTEYGPWCYRFDREAEWNDAPKCQEWKPEQPAGTSKR